MFGSDAFGLTVGSLAQVCWSGDSRLLASASKDSTVKVWQADAPKRAQHTLAGHFDEVYALDWSPNGQRLASGSKDRTVKMYERWCQLTACSLCSTRMDSPTTVIAYTLVCSVTDGKTSQLGMCLGVLVLQACKLVDAARIFHGTQTFSLLHCCPVFSCLLCAQQHPTLHHHRHVSHTVVPETASPKEEEEEEEAVC